MRGRSQGRCGIDLIAQQIQQRPTPRTLIATLPMDGAIHRVGSQEAAYAERSAPWMASIDGFWSDPGDDDAVVAWVRRAFTNLGEFGTGTPYLNFTGIADANTSAGAQSAFGNNLRRLAEIKAKHDPDNFLRLNNTIAPARGASAPSPQSVPHERRCNGERRHPATSSSALTRRPGSKRADVTRRRPRRRRPPRPVDRELRDSDEVVPFGRLVEPVATAEPDARARCLLWIVDSGSSHRGQRSVERLQRAWANLVLAQLPFYASWLDQVEIVFSVIQRKVLTPNDFASLQAAVDRLDAFTATRSPNHSHGT